MHGLQEQTGRRADMCQESVATFGTKCGPDHRRRIPGVRHDVEHRDAVRRVGREHAPQQVAAGVAHALRRLNRRPGDQAPASAPTLRMQAAKTGQSLQHASSVRLHGMSSTWYWPATMRGKSCCSRTRLLLRSSPRLANGSTAAHRQQLGLICLQRRHEQGLHPIFSSWDH